MKIKLVAILVAISLMGPAYAGKPQPEPIYQGICWEFAGYKICLN